MSAGFTPGLWCVREVSDLDVGHSIEAHGQPVADTYRPYSEANAHLIAAAPEIYQEASFICERLRDFSWTVDANNAEDIYRDFHGHVIPSLARLEMLLGKARGE